jgi:HlyD family secretion protein
MTATASIKSDVRKNVVTLPNAALRFTPPQPAQLGRKSRQTAQRRVWILEGQTPVPVVVRTGVSDGERTELLSGEVKPGQKLQPGQKLLVDVKEPLP